MSKKYDKTIVVEFTVRIENKDGDEFEDTVHDTITLTQHDWEDSEFSAWWDWALLNEAVDEALDYAIDVERESEES